jgi:DegV family protein with EDD domain
MDSNFVITTESNSELPYSWEDQTGVSVLRMPYSVNDVEYYYDLGRETDIAGFYATMRGGANVVTAQRNPNEIVEYFEPHLLAGKDILHVGFSSALSGTFSCELIAAQELREKYPERRIELVDTLAISAPLALLVEQATHMQEEGRSLDEIRDWVEENKQRSVALFTVDNLEYLRRGGRLSGVAAFFGTVLEIKPVLYISPEGKLVPLEKVKGRKRAIKYLAEKCAQTIDKPEEQSVIISQADCMEDALALKTLLLETVRPKEVRIFPVGPVIGSHAGPGTVSLAYFCRARSEIKA